MLFRSAFQHLSERGAGARHAARHRAERAVADARRLFVRHAAGADEDQRLALVLRQFHQAALEVGHLAAVFLVRGSRHGALDRSLVIFADEFVAAHLRQEGVAQNDEGPRRSEEHTSELQSLMRISYAVFCLTKKNTDKSTRTKTFT